MLTHTLHIAHTHIHFTLLIHTHARTHIQITLLIHTNLTYSWLVSFCMSAHSFPIKKALAHKHNHTQHNMYTEHNAHTHNHTQHTHIHRAHCSHTYTHTTHTYTQSALLTHIHTHPHTHIHTRHTCPRLAGSHISAHGCPLRKHEHTHCSHTHNTHIHRAHCSHTRPHTYTHATPAQGSQALI
jgi:hypothetical protein